MLGVTSYLLDHWNNNLLDSYSGRELIHLLKPGALSIVKNLCAALDLLDQTSNSGLVSHIFRCHNRKGPTGGREGQTQKGLHSLFQMLMWTVSFKCPTLTQVCVCPTKSSMNS